MTSVRSVLFFVVSNNFHIFIYNKYVFLKVVCWNLKKKLLCDANIKSKINIYVKRLILEKYIFPFHSKFILSLTYQNKLINRKLLQHIFLGYSCKRDSRKTAAKVIAIFQNGRFQNENSKMCFKLYNHIETAL